MAFHSLQQRKKMHLVQLYKFLYLPYTWSVEAVFWLNLYQIRKYSIVPLQPPTILTKQKRSSKKFTYIGAGKECFNPTIFANFSSHVISRSPFNFLLLLSNEVQKRSRLERIKERSPQVLWVLHILGLVALALEKEPILGVRELLVLLPILIVLTGIGK